MGINIAGLNIVINFRRDKLISNLKYLERHFIRIVIVVLSLVSILTFFVYYENGIGLAYNDARSHLDIARRVVEGLKPGLAQIGSVWLPLPHVLMIPTVWNDFFWHSGLSGAIFSMASYVAISILIFFYLDNLKVGLLGKTVAIIIFAFNLNILYLQSTAMTELILMASMTAASYYLMLWHKNKNLLYVLTSAFFVLLSTMIRYDGWFLLIFSLLVLSFTVYRKKGYKEMEGMIILFATLAGFGIFLWFLWNLLIFKDPLYFAFGPFSAHAQQEQIYQAGELYTKGNLWLSVKTYLYAVMYNSYTIPFVLSILGFLMLQKDRKIRFDIRFSTYVLISPFFFNILALYLGHSVLFVEGIVGNTWFNVRYGMMMMPAICVFIGYMSDRLVNLRWIIFGILFLVLFFSFRNYDVVTIDDALIGASGKNVAEVSGWLKENAANKKGFILISAASHDAIIFSSGLPMKRFIHEGTGKYWENATENPDKWARWMVLRTNDMSDWTFREIVDAEGFKNFELVDHYPFADIYQIKDEYLSDLITEPILKQ